MSDPVQEGQVAQRILDDPVFQRAFAEADRRFVDEWRDAETVDVRERAHAKQAALEEVIKQLRTIVGSGEHEAARRE